MSDRVMMASQWRQRSFAVLAPLVIACVLGLGALGGCGAGDANSTTVTAEPRRPLYRPGQSLDARLCECRECFSRACCSGEPETPADSEPEFGISLNACGRCVRRTWTVRGSDACASNAPSECCSGTVAN